MSAWTLQIDGCNPSIHADGSAALDQLGSCCAHYWGAGWDTEPPMLMDRDERIARYFDIAGENYSLSESAAGG